MKKFDAYKIAREYAAEQFIPSQPEFWIYISAFLDGYKAATVDSRSFEKVITGIRFYFTEKKIEVPLEHPIKIESEKNFILELKKITNAKAVNVW